MKQGIPQTLEALTVPIDSVRPYKRNPRRGDIAIIVKSLRRHGQYRPVVVNARTSEVLAGNHTLAAAQELGWPEIAATFIDVDEDTAARIVLIDNRSSDVAGYDEAALAEVLGSLPDLEGTGYDESAVAALLDSAPNREGEDTAPEPPPKKPKTKLGDVYVMGPHRLICGDSTEAATLEALLEGEPAGLVYTDPPYGMSYSSANLGRIAGDDLRGDELLGLVQSALELAAAQRAAGAATYVWCTWRTYPEFRAALAACELEPSACIVWRKGSIGPGSADYRPEHEFCLYCRPDEEGDHDLCLYCAGDEWNGGRGESDVWEVPRDARYVHPTQKPTALAERALKNSSSPGALVLDVFAGSGSTLIAAENIGRRARVVELDPRYCDVIVDRWQRHTGRTAERQRG